MKLLQMLWLSLPLFATQVEAHINIEQITGNTMGTTYTIQLRLEDSNATKSEIKTSVEQELERVNDALSVFRVDSEISTLNENETGVALPVSKYLWDVLKIAQAISAQTDGALDVTLGPVIEFWGFGVKPRDLQHKDRGQLEYARSKTGMNGFSLDAGTLTKVIAGLQINPSAVAKGYGVDRIAEVLDKAGVSHYLVEIGGEVKTRGVGARGLNWKVAVTRPQKLSLEFQRVFTLKDFSMATSGSYVNYFESNDQHLSHIFNPNTGMPIWSDLLSVTVLHESCAVADAFATSMMVLTVERSLQIANKLVLPVMIIEQTDSGQDIHYSESIYQYMYQTGQKDGI
ncbi:FAD:protein FMN transferase [Shewanella sp. UCD-KL12]|uniref:FAD:protein FMN transferase n=1 Tax=Shewanella sp. UCD-KL12 TaxID=1917163 RepID=UPI0009706584|nr:FAD:protein FMN transferase [Shewanella sp. UCD-KL12]